MIFVLLFSAIGAVFLVVGRATSPSTATEAESSLYAQMTTKEKSTSASGGSFIQFNQSPARGGASPGGTYADWFFPGTGLDSIEWTDIPVKDPPSSLTAAGLLHYYAYTFSVTNATSAVGFGYAGFQTNGYINGVQRGRVINFSIWASNGGKTSGPGIINSNNQESGGYQIMYPFNWVVGRHYAFQLKPGLSGTDSQGKWWGLYVTDKTTGTTTFIGEERVQTSINGLSSSQLKPHTGRFGEDLHWWRSLNGSTKYLCSDFESSAMATINVTANNGTIKPNGFNEFTNSMQQSVDSGNGYTTTNCPVTNYADGKMNVQMNLGYWSTGAPNALQGL